MGRDDLHRRRLGYHPPQPVRQGRNVRVVLHPGPQVACLADVHCVALAIEHAIDARRRRHRSERGANSRDPARDPARSVREANFRARVGFGLDIGCRHIRRDGVVGDRRSPLPVRAADPSAAVGAGVSSAVAGPAARRASVIPSSTGCEVTIFQIIASISTEAVDNLVENPDQQSRKIGFQLHC